MRLELTAKEIAFRDELREFYNKHVDQDWRSKIHDFDEYGAYQHEWDRTLDREGWAAPAWPVEYGGRAIGAVERAILAEETARFGVPLGLARIGKALVAPTLMRYGTEEQKLHITKILSGEEIWCQGFSEPDAGSDLPGLRTRARLDGDTWVINGRKIWTSFAQFAQWVFLLVRTGTVDSRANGISVLLVNLDAPGIQIQPIKTLSGKSEFNEVTFDDVRIPADRLLGEENDGWRIVRTTLQHERGVNFCLARFTDVRRNLTKLVEHSKAHPESERVQNGVLGELYARTFGIQLLASDLLYREQEDAIPPGFESLLKLYTTETWRRLGNEQVLRWGAPLFDEGGTEQLEDYYESRHYTISAGTSEIQRNIIASRLLNLPSDQKMGTKS